MAFIEPLQEPEMNSSRAPGLQSSSQWALSSKLVAMVKEQALTLTAVCCSLLNWSNPSDSICGNISAACDLQVTCMWPAWFMWWLLSGNFLNLSWPQLVQSGCTIITTLACLPLYCWDNWVVLQSVTGMMAPLSLSEVTPHKLNFNIIFIALPLHSSLIPNSILWDIINCC